MKALIALAAALLCGSTFAQDSRAVCLGFCDADAKTCREPQKSPAWTAAEAVLFLHGSGATPEDDKEKERQVRSQRCGDARQACRQKCAPPVAAPAAAVTASAASAPG